MPSPRALWHSMSRSAEPSAVVACSLRLSNLRWRFSPVDSLHSAVCPPVPVLRVRPDSSVEGCSFARRRRGPRRAGWHTIDATRGRRALDASGSTTSATRVSGTGGTRFSAQSSPPEGSWKARPPTTSVAPTKDVAFPQPPSRTLLAPRASVPEGQVHSMIRRAVFRGECTVLPAR